MPSIGLSMGNFEPLRMRQSLSFGVNNSVAQVTRSPITRLDPEA